MPFDLRLAEGRIYRIERASQAGYGGGRLVVAFAGPGRYDALSIEEIVALIEPGPAWPPAGS